MIEKIKFKSIEEIDKEIEDKRKTETIEVATEGVIAGIALEDVKAGDIVRIKMNGNCILSSGCKYDF